MYVKIDMFVPEMNSFNRSVCERVSYIPIAPDAPRPYCLPSAEDIILIKLQWYVLGNMVSSNQRYDVIGVLQTQAGDLDLAYLRRWATILNLREVFEQCMPMPGSNELVQQLLGLAQD